MYPRYIRTFLKAEVVLHPHLCVVIMVIIFLKKKQKPHLKNKRKQKPNKPIFGFKREKTITDTQPEL